MSALPIVYLHDGVSAIDEIAEALRAGGLECELLSASDDEAFAQALARADLALILAAPSAGTAPRLALAQEKRSDVPLLFLGTPNDWQLKAHERTTELIDWLPAGDLTQLAPAVRRMLREARTRAELRRAQEALLEVEERYRRFVDEDAMGEFRVRPDGGIVDCSAGFTLVFGFDCIEEALAGNFLALFRTAEEAAAFFHLVRSRGTLENHEIEMRQRRGQPVYISVHAIGAFDAAGELTEVQGYLYNDTKRKRMEQQIMQAQRMEGLGTLAGGIAHDFNNILAIILGYTTQLERSRMHPEQVPIALNVIKDAVERGAALVRQLLISAQQSESRVRPLNLNSTVVEIEKMLAATFPKTIDFKLRLHPNLPLVTADQTQMHQVLLNLSVNARDAMPDGGTMTIETSVIGRESLSESFPGTKAEHYVCLRVIDSGTGMTQEVKTHIFDPFFTTKERGKGTGLGLAVVYGVVNNHRGFVQVDSEPGYGTTFSIYLPLETPLAKQIELDLAAPAAVSDKPAMILLVEDEEMLRELGITMLESEGYRVLTAKDGVEAVELFETHRDEIGMVICDLGLPRLGGREVFLKMKESKPDVRVIVASGYLEPNLRSEILKAGVIDTLQKPYDFREMLKKIRAIIGTPA